jgi:hypothetical protein
MYTKEAQFPLRNATYHRYLRVSSSFVPSSVWSVSHLTDIKWGEKSAPLAKPPVSSINAHDLYRVV